MYRKPLIVARPDEPTGGAAGVAEPPALAPAGGDDATRQQHTVPLVELQKERKSKKALEEQLAAANKIIAEAEAAKLSDTERLTAENLALAAERDALKGELTATAKGSLVRSAAKDFTDPEDAIAILQSRGALAEIETAEDAERVVKGLATDKPHLLRVSDAERTTRPGIEQVLRDGLGIDQQAGQEPAAGDDGQTLTRAQLLALSTDEMLELQTKHPEKYARSVAAQSK